MTHPRPLIPPLSPVLLAGFAMRPLPAAFLQPVLDAAVAAIRRRHPGVFDRLAGLDDPVFLIDPVDLPLVFILRPNPQSPRLVAAKQADPSAFDAVIRGPLLKLIDLLEGRIDGDALFFSRELTIEGDTEAVVALRNAVDGAEIDLVGDILSRLGPLARPARRAIGLAGAVFARVAEDLEALRAAIIAPAIRCSDSQAAELRNLDDRLDALAARKWGPRSRPG